MKKLAIIILISVACASPSDKKPDVVTTDTTTAVDSVPLLVAVGPAVDPIPTGSVLQEYQDGTGLGRASGKIADGPVKAGLREGSWADYHSTGRIKSITGYVAGKKEGAYMEVNETGQVVRTVNYHNNMRHGVYKSYNFTTLTEERTYVNDKLEGVVTVYYDDGKVMEEGNYKNGTRDGISKWYDRNGKVSIQYEYKEGELVKN